MGADKERTDCVKKDTRRHASKSGASLKTNRFDAIGKAEIHSSKYKQYIQILKSNQKVTSNTVSRSHENEFQLPANGNQRQTKHIILVANINLI